MFKAKSYRQTTDRVIRIDHLESCSGDLKKPRPPSGHVFHQIKIISTILVKEHLILFKSDRYFWTRRFLKFLQCTYSGKQFFSMEWNNLNYSGRRSPKEHLCICAKFSLNRSVLFDKKIFKDFTMHI